MYESGTVILPTPHHLPPCDPSAPYRAPLDPLCFFFARQRPRMRVCNASCELYSSCMLRRRRQQQRLRQRSTQLCRLRSSAFPRHSLNFLLHTFFVPSSAPWRERESEHERKKERVAPHTHTHTHILMLLLLFCCTRVGASIHIEVYICMCGCVSDSYMFFISFWMGLFLLL